MAAKAINPGLEIILQTLLGTVAAVGSTYLVTLLDQLQAKSPDKYSVHLLGIYSGFLELKGLAEASTTKIDDSLIIPVMTALEASAKKYKIKLPK